jgi:hypothetical protein
MRTGRRTWRIGLAVLLDALHDALHGIVIADARRVNKHTQQTNTHRESS